MCAGTFATFYYDSTGSNAGAWDINPAAVAVFESAPGVTGVSAGSATPTYTYGGCSTYRTIYVTNCDGISGTIWSLGSSMTNADVKIWLFGYNSATSSYATVDSTMSYTCYTNNQGAYYTFNAISSGNYIVKAQRSDSLFIPSYYNGTFYWDFATVIAHTAGVSDFNQDINLLSDNNPASYWGAHECSIHGVVTTDGGAPVVGLRISVWGPATGLTYMEYTDNSGHYAFDSLGEDTYTVFPDSLNFITMPYTNVILNASFPSTNLFFLQYLTGPKTIQPIPEYVTNIANAVSSIITYPSPTSGRLNIRWQEKNEEAGTVNLCDVTGREVMRTAIIMNKGNGVKTIDLSGLANGIYMITVKTPSNTYINKVEKE